MLACARGVTTAGRGDEVDVRSGGDSARVDSGGLLWYGAKLWAMVAVSNVTFGKPRRCSRRKEARQESFVCCYLVCLGITVTAACPRPSELLASPWFLRLGETHRSFSNKLFTD